MKAQISVSAEKIKTMVSKNDLANKLSLYSTIQQTADAISTKVSKDDLELRLCAYSTIEQTADYIQTRVSKQPDMKNAIPINDISEAKDTSQIYVIRQKNGDTVIAETHYYYSDLLKRWEVLSGDSIYTVFKNKYNTQTEDYTSELSTVNKEVLKELSPVYKLKYRDKAQKLEK